jgi:hypothetical protein
LPFTKSAPCFVRGDGDGWGHNAYGSVRSRVGDSLSDANNQQASP